MARREKMEGREGRTIGGGREKKREREREGERRREGEIAERPDVTRQRITTTRL